MGYRIQYGGKEPTVSRGKHSFWGTAALVILLVVTGVRILWPDSVQQAWELLIPGITASQEAFSDMVDQLKNGADVGEAVTAFCSDVIQKAVEPDEAEN